MPRSQPQRMCVACRQKTGQGRLLRLRRDRQGRVTEGLRPRAGRGAYVCPRLRCLNKALRKGGALRALRAQQSTTPERVVAAARETLRTRLARLEASGGAAHEREELTALLAALSDMTMETAPRRGAARSPRREPVDETGLLGTVAPRDQQAGLERGLGKAHG